MRFAIVNAELIEAQAGGKGICPGCNQPVIAKCGTERINHWAHLRNIACDNWWEPETEWHREWKNHFPREWQEKFLPDIKTGEKHMADVRTEHGLVLEFQHSHIALPERISREKFYGNMVWVVDGTRLKRDLIRFHKGKNELIPDQRQGLFIAQFPDECFPSSWLNSLVPVLFDFKNLGAEGEFQEGPHCLYCLYPNVGKLDSLVAVLTKEFFIELSINGTLVSLLKSFVDERNQLLKAYRQQQQQNMLNNFLHKPRRYRRGL